MVSVAQQICSQHHYPVLFILKRIWFIWFILKLVKWGCCGLSDTFISQLKFWLILFSSSTHLFFVSMQSSGGTDLCYHQHISCLFIVHFMFSKCSNSIILVIFGFKRILLYQYSLHTFAFGEHCIVFFFMASGFPVCIWAHFLESLGRL